MHDLLLSAFLSLLLTAAWPTTIQRTYEELPLGSIKAEGWLLQTLRRQKEGVTADLDERWPRCLGADNAWLGGDGDRWERAQLWMDGLIPLAWILDDDVLKAKAGRWMDAVLSSQTESGQFGPLKDGPKLKGTQPDHSEDWWMRMSWLQPLIQYYHATQDSRVPVFLDRFFRYQLETIPRVPLTHQTGWSAFRYSENMMAALWLYQKTGEPYLLELCELLHRSGFDFVAYFNTDDLCRRGSIHGVNLAIGLKEPVIYWQIHPEQKYLDAEARGLELIRRYNGFPNGMFGGDEALHGNNPTQGSELCSAVELSFSMEEMLKATGNPAYAELLERIVFNALPAQTSDDFHDHQYFQQVNQVSLTRNEHLNSDVDHKGTSHVFGFLTGYPCCLSNLHKAWPKFTQNLWYRNAGKGFSAMAYAPCRFEVEIEPGVILRMEEKTFYPFEEKIRFEISFLGTKGRKPLEKAAYAFPLEFRIPSWSTDACLEINGERVGEAVSENKVSVTRPWRHADVIELALPMQVSLSRWYENAVSVERGPLLYALEIDAEWTRKEFRPEEDFGACYWEVTPKSPWNYALTDPSVACPSEWFHFSTDPGKLAGGGWFWSEDGAPVRLRVKAPRFPGWEMYDGQAGPLPYSRVPSGGEFNLNGALSIRRYAEGDLEEVTLLPYGCTTLRIAEFPVMSPETIK